MFNDTTNLSMIVIDSAANNKWQIGYPHKSVFTKTKDNSMAIVTDTTNTLPINDTSVFYIKHYRNKNANTIPSYSISISFQSKLDGDSNDIGIIEISPDTGRHWVNVVTQSAQYGIQYFYPVPCLNGSTMNLPNTDSGWQSVYFSMMYWPAANSGFPVLWNADTFLIRFTYITDSVNTPRDGWIIDNIQLVEGTESILETITNNSIISIAPNPVEDVLHIKRKIGVAKNESVQLMNMMGEVVFSGQWWVVGVELSVDVSGLAKGVYLLRYSCDKGEARERFVKE